MICQGEQRQKMSLRTALVSEGADMGSFKMEVRLQTRIIRGIMNGSVEEKVIKQ